MAYTSAAPPFEEQETRKKYSRPYKGGGSFKPIPRGGKIGLFGGAGVGKTVLIMELIRNIATERKGYSVLPE